MVGLAAIPPLRIGPDRCEALLFDAAEGTVAREARLEQLLESPPLRVLFTERIANFSLFGVGPWLRDQIFTHVDMLNERGGWQLDTHRRAGLPCWMEPAAENEALPDGAEARGDAEAPAAYWSERGGVFGGSLPCREVPRETDAKSCMNVD